MKFFLLLVVAVLAAYFVPAPPTHQESSIEIGASRGKVWDTLSDLGAARNWDPAVRAAHVVSTHDQGVGAERKMEDTMLKTDETVTEWVPYSKIGFEVEYHPDLTQYENSTLRLQDAGSYTKVIWTLDYQMRGGYLGAALDRMFLRALNDQRLDPALANLKHLVETGEAPLTF